LDEALTVVPAVRADGLASLVAEVRSLDTQPPLSHMVIYGLRDLLPAGEFGLRLPNFVAMQVGLIFLFLAIRRIWGAPMALVAVAFAQVSPYLAFYGAEARNYGLWFAAVGASWWLLVCWTGAAANAATEAPPGGGRGPGRAALIIAWGLVNGLGLLVHLFQLFSLASQWAAIGAVAAAIPRGPGRRRLLAAGAAGTFLAFALFAPWAAMISAQAADGAAGVNWTRPPSVKTIAALPYALALGFSWGSGRRIPSAWAACCGCTAPPSSRPPRSWRSSSWRRRASCSAATAVRARRIASPSSWSPWSAWRGRSGTRSRPIFPSTRGT
jgi:hypothetical protein